MVTVTSGAAVELKRIRDSQELEASQCLRLAPVGPDTLGLVVDEAREDDDIVEHEGTPVLLIGPAVSSALEGAAIDFQATEEGSRFSIRPPAED